MDVSKQVCMQKLWKNDGHFIFTAGFAKATSKSNVTAHKALKGFLNFLTLTDELRKYHSLNHVI